MTSNFTGAFQKKLLAPVIDPDINTSKQYSCTLPIKKNLSRDFDSVLLLTFTRCLGFDAWKTGGVHSYFVRMKHNSPIPYHT
jgi:hypothetical protein